MIKKRMIMCGLLSWMGAAALQAQVRVHTIGDSTMADYAENTTRTRGWGEMLQEFFSADVQVMNYARGGRSSRSFWEEGRWQTVKDSLRTGDYVFIQFAHNDEKEGGKDGADFRGTAPWTTYKSFLELYVDETRQAGAKPVFVTPIVRRYFDKAGRITPKGCHDLSIAPDDSTLNYVRVMKSVARQKQVPVVDMTALTKQFVEGLGQENTVRRIYVPTDGTHTQATGAACYARIAVAELKRQGILSQYIHTDIPMVLNPVSLDLGTVYIGDEAIQCFDVTGMKLLPESGVLSVKAPVGMTLSAEPHSASRQCIELPYADGKCWNTSLFLHFKPEADLVIQGDIVITTGTQERRLPVKAVGKSISHKTETVLQSPDVQLKGMKANAQVYTIDQSVWPADIDESAGRYVEFVVRNRGEKTLVLRQLSFVAEGRFCYRMAYARGKDFYPRTDIGENQRDEQLSGKQTFAVNATIDSGESLHIRLFPWSVSGGAMDFKITDWKVEGFEVD